MRHLLLALMCILTIASVGCQKEKPKGTPPTEPKGTLPTGPMR